MNDCEHCRHEWHGGAMCRETVTVIVTYRMYFTESGAGSNYADDVDLSNPGEIGEAKASCGCRGLAA